MFRKYVIISLAASLVLFNQIGCTSKSATDESADVEEISDSGDESLESAEATEDNSDLASESTDGAVADLGDEDGLAPDEKLPGDAPATDIAQSGDASSDLTETPPADSIAANDPPPDAGLAPMDNPPSDEVASNEPPPDSSPSSESNIGSSSVSEPGADSTSSAPVASLKKINAQPYHQGKILVNAVYIARKGDSVEGISQKVFGSPDHVKDICKINAYNCNRGIKVGDKFYYNSPQRPTDETTVKTFYDDAGIAPQFYTAKSGDNIRKVGKELLGHERSWMELWATNDVESKGDLDEGVQLKYWPATETAVPTQTIASNEAPPAPAPPPVEEVPPAPEQPPMPEQAMNEPPPPPDLPPAPDQQAMGSIEPPPPPPPPPPTEPPHDAMAAGDAQDPNQTMALGVGAILLLAAAALFISVRKKRARRHIDFNTSTQTQID